MKQMQIFKAIIVDFNNDERVVFVEAVNKHQAHYVARFHCKPEQGERVFYVTDKD